MTPLLAQRLRADRSFERVYRRHLGDVYRYAVAVLRHPSDAEDVTQTTFLNAYRAYQRGERPRDPHNWLITIAHNVCRQRFRQSQRRPDEVSFDDTVAQIVPEDEKEGPTVADVQRALGHLAFNQRTALVMRELEGRSYSEIAELLGLTVSAVETLIFRARRALREQLDGTLTCADAERAISLQADGKLARADRGSLRAHLRECRECDRLARSQRAQRQAFKALAVIPIPTSLTSLFGGGTAVGGGMAAKAAAVVAAGAVVTGVGYESAKIVREPAPKAAVAAAPAGPTDPVEAREAQLVVAERPARALPAPPVAKGRGASAKLEQLATFAGDARKAVPPGQAKKRATEPARVSPAQRAPKARQGRRTAAAAPPQSQRSSAPGRKSAPPERSKQVPPAQAKQQKKGAGQRSGPKLPVEVPVELTVPLPIPLP